MKRLFVIFETSLIATVNAFTGGFGLLRIDFAFRTPGIRI